MAAAAPPRLYQILELSPDCSQSDIKKAYHQMALKYHPDKNPNGAEQMSMVNEAYEVLKDPKKRAAYDKYGDRGLEALNNPYASNFAQTIGMGAMIWLAALFLFIGCFCLISLMGTVSAKVDGSSHQNWATTLWPLWLWDAIIMLGVTVATVMFANNRCKEGAESGVTWHTFITPVTTTLYFITTALIGARLNGAHSLDWAIVFLPYWVASCVDIIRAAPQFRPQLIQLAYARSGVIAPGWLVGLTIFNSVCGHLYAPICTVLGVLKTDSLSWGVVFAPFYAYLGLFVVHHCANVCVSTSQQEQFQENKGCARICGVLQAGIGICLPLASAIMIQMKFDGVNDRKLAICLIPMFILVSIVLLLSCILFCYATAVLKQEVEKAEMYQDAADAEQQ